MAVLELHLRADPRHCDFTAIGIDPPSDERRFPHWVMGYADLDLDGTGLDISALAQTDGHEALQRFATAIKTLDIL